MGAGHGEHLRVLGAARARFAPRTGDRVERHEGHALLAAGAQEGLLLGPGAEPVQVLYADHRRDGPGLGEVFGLHVGQAEVADEPGLAQLGQGAEALGDRIGPDDAQVHHVEVVAAELAQVLLDLAAQLLRGGVRQPLPGRASAGADLGGDDEVVRVRCQSLVDQLVGGAQRGEVEGGGVDVVDAELDGAAQYADRPAAVAGGGAGGERRAVLGQSHRAEADAVHFEVAEFPGARGGRGDRLSGHAGMISAQ